MTTSRLASWLQCTHCRQPLEALEGLVLGCASGHRFDGNRRGYLTALDSSRGIHGDTRPILEARARFLAGRHFEPIADAVLAALPADRALAVLDSGTGTGYYLQHVIDALPHPVDALAVDASNAAVAMAVAATRSCGLVADVWRPSPVRAARADAILCIFAPRNPAEFARTLRSEGTVIVVTPAQQHLAELRAAGLVLGMQADKLAHLDASMQQHLDLVERQRVHYSMELSAAAGADLAGMGPSGHHERRAAWPGGTATVSVDLSVYSGRRAD